MWLSRACAAYGGKGERFHCAFDSPNVEGKGSVISVEGLTKNYGSRTALDNFSCDVGCGTVTAIVGPNGSGKSTLFRILLGLTRPDYGTATFNGIAYGKLQFPLLTVGAHIDSNFGMPFRSAYQFLKIQAISQGIPTSRVLEVLAQVGLGQVAKQRIGKFSLGMKQRLGIALALLGEPKYYVFDEPLNGLDHDGILWFRELVAQLKAGGATVFLSSHLLLEVERVADHVIFIGKGLNLGAFQMDRLTSCRNQLVLSSGVSPQTLPSPVEQKLVRVGDLLLVPDAALEYWTGKADGEYKNSFRVAPFAKDFEEIYEQHMQASLEFAGETN
jgi:ABC-2 type transport system ATP-binding protein